MVRGLAVAAAAACAAAQWSTTFPALPAGWTAEQLCRIVDSGDGPNIFYNGTYMLDFNDPHANGGVVIHLDGVGAGSCPTRAAVFYPPLTSYGTYTAIVQGPHDEQSGAAAAALFFMSLYNAENGDQILFEIGADGNFCALNFHDNLKPWKEEFNLWFDPAAEFFSITIDWQPNSVVWSVRGTTVCKYGTTAPQGPLAPHFILRAANGYSGTPTVACVQSASYTP